MHLPFSKLNPSGHPQSDSANMADRYRAEREKMRNSCRYPVHHLLTSSSSRSLSLQTHPRICQMTRLTWISAPGSLSKKANALISPPSFPQIVPIHAVCAITHSQGRAGLPMGEETSTGTAGAEVYVYKT